MHENVGEKIAVKDKISVGVFLLQLLNLSLYAATLRYTPASTLEQASWLEIKYVIYDKNSHSSLEVVGDVWINGGIDWNNRPQKFRAGETVTITCPSEIHGASFCFWQRQESEPTFQGLIVTNRSLTITVNGGITTWWANYAGKLEP